NGLLQGPYSYSTGYYSDSVAAGDLDADGDTDLVTANYEGVWLLPGDGAGGFGVARHYATGSGAASVALGDFNRDGELDIAATAVTEGSSGTVNATFTLTLAYASVQDVTVHYVTADLSAAAGSDYTAASGAVTIPAGRTSATFTVAVKGDRLAEPTETFAVNL